MTGNRQPPGYNSDKFMINHMYVNSGNGIFSVVKFLDFYYFCPCLSCIAHEPVIFYHNRHL